MTVKKNERKRRKKEINERREKEKNQYAVNEPKKERIDVSSISKCETSKHEYKDT